MSTSSSGVPPDVQALYEELERLGPVASFPWHQQQEVALRAATDVVMIVGGNRSGKSQGAQGIMSRLIRREGPIYERLRSPIGRPLLIWVAPQTFEKYKSVWEDYCRKALVGMDYEYVQSPHPVFRWRDKYGGGSIWGKAQEQGFRSFENDAVDLIIFDEEPEDQRLFNSAMTRFSTTNGVCVLAFTPLLGLTWTYGRFYLPAVKTEYQIGERAWRRGNSITVVQMGMADNPEAVKGGGVARMLADAAMHPAEKDSRLFGKYGFTEGLLIPHFALLTAQSDSIYLVDTLPRGGGVTYDWYLTADPNKRHGALLTAIDSAGNRFYCAEHYAENLPDTAHARAYGEMLGKFDLSVTDVDIYADPGGAGAQAIINLAEVGYPAKPITKDPGSVAASIKRLRRAAHIDPNHVHPVDGRRGAPHVYFLRDLQSTWMEEGLQMTESRLMWEFRQYRQKQSKDGAAVAPDTPVKEKDDVVDCARYVELAHPEAPTASRRDYTAEARAKLDSVSRQEAEEFERMADRTELHLDALRSVSRLRR